MATTVQQVFDIAMALMDETETAEYMGRALPILNVLRGELYRYSDTFSALEAGTRPISKSVSTFADVVNLDDFIAQSVLPYGLAAQLMLGDDNAKANFFQQRYEELLARYGSVIPTATEDITDLYGGVACPESGLR